LTTAGLSARLDHLEHQGFLVQREDENDPQQVTLELTDRGLKLVDDLLPGHVENEERLLAPLTDEDRHTLNRLLATLIAPLERA
jgi:DNA-binding MarR family transcriptional regulator